MNELPTLAVVSISTIPAKREYAAPTARSADETASADHHTMKVLHARRRATLLIGGHGRSHSAAVAPAAQDVSTGSTYIIVPLASRRAVDAAVVDPLKLRAVRTASGPTGFAIYAFTIEPGKDAATSYSRLVPPIGVNEDPATGSAAGPAGCFMVTYGFVAADKGGTIVNAQGVLVKRPSRIHIKIASASGEITQVKVGGVSVVVGEGTASV